jgi:hypothetical protein
MALLLETTVRTDIIARRRYTHDKRVAKGASRNKFQAGGTGVSPVWGSGPARRRSHRSNYWTSPNRLSALLWANDGRS